MLAHTREKRVEKAKDMNPNHVKELLYRFKMEYRHVVNIERTHAMQQSVQLKKQPLLQLRVTWILIM